MQTLVEEKKPNRLEDARVLVTGATGFMGSHLVEYLLKKGLVVYGVKRRRSKMDNVEHLDHPNLYWIVVDITDPHSIHRALIETEPEYIFHLAAQSFVPQSWRAPLECLMTNAGGTLNILEAVLQCGGEPIVQIAGSSEEYGLVKEDEVPIKETNPLHPLSPYGVSKVAADLYAQQMHQSYGLKTVITRAFNHTGPRRGEEFVCSSFAKQIVCGGTIHVGNINAIRDFTDVRDMARAYWLSVQHCEYGTPYNICEGNGHSIRDILDQLLDLQTARIRDYNLPYPAERPEIVKNEKLIRPADVELLVGDSTKFRKATGWVPRIPFGRTLRDLLHYWSLKTGKITGEIRP